MRRKLTTNLVLTAILVLMSAAVRAQDVTAVENARPGEGVTLTGTITDAASHAPLVGIRLRVEDFSAAITDSTGHFTLRVPTYVSTVIIEGEGYDTRRVALKGRSSIAISLLDEAHESFNETVVMPSGTKIKTELTSSVGQYNLNSGWTKPLELPDAILQGRVAGLNVIRRSGAPGVGASLFLRGYNSLYATNRPLIIIDNMLYDANDYGESIIANNYTNPLALVDIKDIDNITVLKDASSIYGTKGANGAIIITTARAHTQATKIDFATYAGINFAPKNLPVMDAYDYRIYLNEILQSQGMSVDEIQSQPYMNDDPSDPLYAMYHFDNDWQKKVLANGINQNYFLKVTGGDNIATYGLSMGYARNEGVVKGTDITRYNTRFNAEFNFTKRFTGNTNLSFSYNEQNLKDQGIADKTAPLYLGLIKAPFLNSHQVNEKGVESPNLSDADSFGISNPAAIIQNMQAYNKYYRFAGSFDFHYELSKSWKASTLIGVVFDKVRENFFVPKAGVSSDTLSNAVVYSRMGSQVKRLFSIYNDTRLVYTKKFNANNRLSARVGLRSQKNQSERDFALGFNSATDDLTSVQTGVNELRQVGGGIGDWNWLNGYLGAEYALRDKFFLNYNMAVDGSSRFGPDAPGGIQRDGGNLAVMPSIGAAWLVSSEDFMAHSSIDLFKLRATYSITGNDDIGNYSARRTYVSQNLLGAEGLVRNGVANPELQWETVKKLNGGIDLAFWNERVGLSVDVYKNKTSDMLVYESLPAPSGFETILTNGGSMQNTGFDVSLNIRAVNTPSLTWDLGLDAGTYKNKVLAVPGGSIETHYAGATILTEEGKAANLFYGYKTQGVFATDAEAAGLSKKNPDGSVTAFRGGDVKFVDMDGNKVIDENDRTVIGDPNPSFTGGISNRVAWKQFELNALFTFKQGGDVYNYLRSRLESETGVANQLVSVNNRWRGQGQVTTMPKARFGDPMGNSRFSDRWIEDGSYFRLRSLSLNYRVPMKEGAVLKAITLYATGNNVFTLTKYKGFDPEFSSTPTVFTQGIDIGLDPLYRSVTLGVRLGL